MNQVSILILDDDAATQEALQHVLDSEGWRLKIVPMAQRALGELASGAWTLAIVNVAMTGLEGPLFTTLLELAQAPPMLGERRRLRVLFLLPELAGAEAQTTLERQQLPYTLKPFHLHDFLEKVSDLLLEAQAIPGPIRRVRSDAKPRERRGRERRAKREQRSTPMFAAREDYYMTEEEIAEYERQETEERKKKEKKKHPGEGI